MRTPLVRKGSTDRHGEQSPWSRHGCSPHGLDLIIADHFQTLDQDNGRLPIILPVSANTTPTIICSTVTKKGPPMGRPSVAIYELTPAGSFHRRLVFSPAPTGNAFGDVRTLHSSPDSSQRRGTLCMAPAGRSSGPDRFSVQGRKIRSKHRRTQSIRFSQHGLYLQTHHCLNFIPAGSPSGIL